MEEGRPRIEDGGRKKEESGKRTEDGGRRRRKKDRGRRMEDGGFTSELEDGVKRRGSQVKGHKPKGKGQNRGEEWKADDGGRQAEQRRSHRVWPDLALHQ